MFTRVESCQVIKTNILHTGDHVDHTQLFRLET